MAVVQNDIWSARAVVARIDTLYTLLRIVSLDGTEKGNVKHRTLLTSRQ